MVEIKLKAEMKKRIVKFYFQKIDGSLREAYGTTNPETRRHGSNLFRHRKAGI